MQLPLSNYRAYWFFRNSFLGSIDPSIMTIFLILLVGCSFAMGWIVGYEICRSKMLRTIRESWNVYDVHMAAPPVDTTYEPIKDTIVYDLAEFRDRKKSLQKDKEIEETLEWELVWSDEDYAYTKVSSREDFDDSDDSM